MFKKKEILRSKFKVNKNSVKNTNCTEFEVDNWVLSKFILKKLISVVGIHPFPLNELLLMTAAIVRTKPDVIFEWGTNIGKSARIFWETINYFSMDCKIHSIDLPDDIAHPEHPYKKRGYLVKSKNVDLHLGDGIDVSLRLLKNFGYKTPFFFIDGDHSYNSVKRELSIIMKEVPNANILLHDTFYQSEESGYNIGPCMAIRDCLNQINNLYKQISTNTSLPGMSLLYKR